MPAKAKVSREKPAKPRKMPAKPTGTKVPAEMPVELPIPVKAPTGTRVVPARIKVPASKPVPSQALR